MRPYGMRNVTAETISQKIAWAPYEDDCPMVSSATMAQTVKKIMSKRKSDFLSLRFSATSSATAADSPMATLPWLATDERLKFATIRGPRPEPVKPGPLGRGWGGSPQWPRRPLATYRPAAS